jgi:hypothetical protein
MELENLLNDAFKLAAVVAPTAKQPSMCSPASLCFSFPSRVIYSLGGQRLFMALLQDFLFPITSLEQV